MFQIECINEPIVNGIKRCIQENPAGLNNLSVIGEVINNAEKAMISIKETQIRPMSLCCLVPFFVKKIYIPTGIVDSAKKACVNIIDMVIVNRRNSNICLMLSRLCLDYKKNSLI